MKNFLTDLIKIIFEFILKMLISQGVDLNKLKQSIEKFLKILLKVLSVAAPILCLIFIKGYFIVMYI